MGLGRGLELGRESRMRCEQARIYGWDDGKEGNGLLGWIGIRQEGSCQAIPDSGCVKGKLELDSATSEERRKQRVNGAVDVMQGKYM